MRKRLEGEMYVMFKRGRRIVGKLPIYPRFGVPYYARGEKEDADFLSGASADRIRGRSEDSLYTYACNRGESPQPHASRMQAMRGIFPSILIFPTLRKSRSNRSEVSFRNL